MAERTASVPNIFTVSGMLFAWAKSGFRCQWIAAGIATTEQMIVEVRDDI